MNKESLEKAEEAILTALQWINIDSVDKVELMLNLRLLLENYDESIGVLQEHQGKVKKYERNTRHTNNMGSHRIP